MSTTTFNPDQKRGQPGNKAQWAPGENTMPEIALLADDMPAHPLAERFETVELKLDAMQLEVERMVADLATDEGWNSYLDAATKYKNYSFGNQLLIASQNQHGGKVAGKKVWASLGRKVRPAAERGAGISIFAPKKGWFDVTDADGNMVAGPDGKPRRELRTFGFTTCTVYGEHQTAGEPLPDIQRELSEEPPAGFIDDLEAAIGKTGYTIVDSNELGTAKGSTHPDTKTVSIKAGLTPGTRAQVLAHELGHIAAGHTERGGEYHCGPEKVEAESVEYFLLKSHGMRASRLELGVLMNITPESVGSISALGNRVSQTLKGIAPQFRRLRDESHAH